MRAAETSMLNLAYDTGSKVVNKVLATSILTYVIRKCGLEKAQTQGGMRSYLHIVGDR